MSSIFITFEGGEGSGKSTQIHRLAAQLKEQGRDVLITREPGGTAEAEAIRTLLVSGDVARWTAKSEALLNYAAREQHLEQVIRPALAGGKTVLCDRFMDSTRAYQGYAGGCDLGFIDALEKAIVGITRPDLTLVFDLNPAIGLARARSRGDAHAEDRYERKGLAFHQQLREGFLDILRKEPKRCRLVDAAQDIEAVAEDVWSIVKGAL
ncbi:MAG: dTMP kinase [Aestuariivirga sp.]|uniref:dTMP kinase n=1 Tax=Aestuariivirga sp. TaxID=2650926 RepID=UPI0025BA4833|nr:dTMP kinase [Aestuariivirga sp.]MCA3560917.1 dTMP kinase [Aestuariivirga sp.]